jgi:hypothetical protein
MKVSLPTNDLALWHVEFQGAKGTLYEGEQFTLQLRFNNDYVKQQFNIAYIIARSNLHKACPYPRAYLLKRIYLSFNLI